MNIKHDCSAQKMLLVYCCLKLYIYLFTPGPIRMNPPSTFQMVEFITTKLLHVVAVVVIPMMYMSLSSMVSLYWHVIVMNM